MTGVCAKKTGLHISFFFIALSNSMKYSKCLYRYDNDNTCNIYEHKVMFRNYVYHPPG